MAEVVEGSEVEGEGEEEAGGGWSGGVLGREGVPGVMGVLGVRRGERRGPGELGREEEVEGWPREGWCRGRTW